MLFDSFLEQRLLALEAQYGQELQGMQSEKQQLQELLERQSRLVSQLQGELGSSTLNSTLLQRQQAVLTDTVQQLLAMVNHCNGKGEGFTGFGLANSFCEQYIPMSYGYRMGKSLDKIQISKT